MIKNNFFLHTLIKKKRKEIFSLKKVLVCSMLFGGRSLNTLKLFSEKCFIIFPVSAPLGRFSHRVALSVRPCVRVRHWMQFFQASHWPSGHMNSSRSLIGPPSASVTGSLCLSHTVCVGHRQSMSVTDNHCLSQAVCV